MFFFYLNIIPSEAGIVLSLFLIFGDFEPRCPYKIVLITKSIGWQKMAVYLSNRDMYVNMLICMYVKYISGRQKQQIDAQII